MAARNPLLASPPHAVDQAVRGLGANLRIARIRRGLTVRQVAEKIGTGVRAVADAEKGKPATGIAVYAALLWALGLLADFEVLAAPQRDAEGQAVALAHERRRVRLPRGRDNDF